MFSLAVHKHIATDIIKWIILYVMWLLFIFAFETCRNKHRMHENSRTDSRKTKQNKQNKSITSGCIQFVFVVLKFAPNT